MENYYYYLVDLKGYNVLGVYPIRERIERIILELNKITLEKNRFACMSAVEWAEFKKGIPGVRYAS